MLVQNIADEKLKVECKSKDDIDLLKEPVTERLAALHGSFRNLRHLYEVTMLQLSLN